MYFHISEKAIVIFLLTGVAGFIGFHTAQRLLPRNLRLIGIDNFNDYYDPGLKEARVAQLQADPFALHRADIADRAAISAIFGSEPDISNITHLAAQAGLRYSMTNQYEYVHSNVSSDKSSGGRPSRESIRISAVWATAGRRGDKLNE